MVIGAGQGVAGAMPAIKNWVDFECHAVNAVKIMRQLGCHFPFKILLELSSLNPNIFSLNLDCSASIG